MTELQRKNLVIAEFIKSKEDSISALKYHESWDWLMPVVAKIMRDDKWWSMAPAHINHLSDVLPFGYIDEVYEAVFRIADWQKEFTRRLNQIA
jgi:hypothetical protein